MSDRFYRTLFGAMLLIFLYFDLRSAIYGLMAIATFEGITNWRVPTLVWRIRGFRSPPDNNSATLAPAHSVGHFGFEAERAFRLTVVLMLASAFFIPGGFLWWLPWFMGFAIFGAGISGVCPVYFTLRWIGFRDSTTTNQPRPNSATA